MKMWVREFAGYESIFSPPPWISSPKLGPPQRYTRSLPRRSLLHSQAVPGHSKLSKKFVQSKLLTLDFVSFTLNFLGTSRGNQEKRLDDIVVRSYQPAEQDAVLQHASCRTLLVFILVPRTPGNVDVTTEH